MGNENSSIVDESTPPQTLKDRSLTSVAELIKNGGARRIVVITGAGLSTAAGIPDFRSPKTGLYHNLARLNLPYAECVFDISYFRENPLPFYMLAKELYPGKFSPTISHVFIALLANKGLLRMLFTQNIDCLERVAGVPGHRIVEAHGSFATQRCIDCMTEFPDKEMREHIERGAPALCVRPECRGLVKPDIVFFGEQLPSAFFENRSAPASADLLLVLGTSLSVQPFASLSIMAAEGVPRVLFNKEKVGDVGSRADDVLCLGDCDSGVRKLADELGWRDELEQMWRDLVGEKEAERQLSSVKEREADMEDEMNRLVDSVEHKLELADQADEDAVANARQVQVPGLAPAEAGQEGPKTTDIGSSGSQTGTSVQDKMAGREGSEASYAAAAAQGEDGDDVTKDAREKADSAKEQRQPQPSSESQVGPDAGADGDKKKNNVGSSSDEKPPEPPGTPPKPKPVKPQVTPFMTTEEVKGSSVL
ncbi:DHS-like NAD/FAD-binding domain-containing protein [Pseudomassariella vexata]|uniref:DHS-like NAD/FAD-binding domain-containing protein n=1 Tax=Pseudomassariella vexata TaxID=1141098 RepID=A0A1Y2E8J3_9PEZI|nr:DHS-like NAD/FAD-binding domain-containing protein [Pseudomassariella vexata]ORY67747.1 DHS-like NAD/FAD-binding domain-containing protein [Pseudomassariella vexata]